MILGTIDKKGRPYGTAVFMITMAGQLYFITKTDTQKFKNIGHNPHVSVTNADPAENSSLQVTGKAYVVNDATAIEMVMSKMTKVYARSADWLPPLVKLRAGPYQVVRIKVEHARLANFKGKHAGGSDIFKEG